jgi:purine nucleoside permease
MIITGFSPEREIWSPLNLTNYFAIPGFLPQYKNVSCSEINEICIMTMGQAEIGNGIAMTLLWSSPLFDLTRTYFVIAGIAGVNPRHSTIGSVVMPKYVVKVELGNAFAGSDLPPNFSDLYFFSMFQNSPDKYPSISGTEVYEVNEALRNKVIESAKHVKYVDDPESSSIKLLNEHIQVLRCHRNAATAVATTTFRIFVIEVSHKSILLI